MDKSTNATDTWFILSAAHGKYICSSTWPAVNIRQSLSSCLAVDCREVIELITPLNQVPGTDPTQVGIAKDAFATPLDVNSVAAHTSFSLSGARITFFTDMSDVDQEMYKKLITMGRAMADSWRTRRSKIVVPNLTIK
jgi:hypothetical protein